MGEQWQTLYEAIGGEETVTKLVEAFYRRVAAHPDLRPIFPDDLTETARKQKQFLTQYLGGPPLYTAEHGHPMLRARHLRFEITPKRAEAWLAACGQPWTKSACPGRRANSFITGSYSPPIIWSIPRSSGQKGAYP
ncbi:Group 2 truncated hemoglobin YjbI [Geobacillus sp. BCO2]|nr:Group 2 truncated hemoglobin YjbI [Geobacillus sp. BCO2]